MRAYVRLTMSKVSTNCGLKLTIRTPEGGAVIAEREEERGLAKKGLL